MPKKHRLSHKDFSHIPHKGRRRVDGTYFSLSVSVGGVGTSTKTACIISKKAIHKAIDRNKIKRRVREIARPLIRSTQDPIHFIFYTKQTALKASYKNLKADIETLIAGVK